MNLQKISDHELVHLYQAGHEQSFTELFNRHKRSVYTAIYLLVKDQAIAEDIFQETFIKIINTLKSGKYNEEGKFVGWAVRVGRNLTIDYIRKMKRQGTVITNSDGRDVFDFIHFHEPSNEDKLMQMQSEQTLRHMIRKLPEEQKEVLILRHWGKMSFKEIADATGVSVNTSLGRMRYAINNLKKMNESSNVKL
ncbi:MAG: sigma-70 family RNA polymerase sigma factor [Bacteroidetes bacterium]|jgi:RNA polymerase sigma-70 factor (ECF subfamily)|nr:sigma-70 family RNA polymerase sigma factor [Bacteroidota bacterium]